MKSNRNRNPIGVLALFGFLHLMWPGPSQALEPVVAANPVAVEDDTVIQVRAHAETVLSLEQCVNNALLANDALQAERLRMEELDGQMDQALSTGLPTLDLVGDWSRSRNPGMALDSTFGGDGSFMGPPAGSPDWFQQWLGGFGSFIPEAGDIPAQTFLRANLNLAWNINPMKIAGAVGAARLGIDRQKLNERDLENSTVEQAVVAYHDIIMAAEKIKAVEAQLANQTELLDIMRMRHELGMATRLDTLQAAVSLANIEPRLDIARSNLKNQGARLNAIMGRSPETPLAVSTAQVLELHLIDDQVALTLSQTRPDLESLNVFTNILRRNRKAQKSENMPYITVAGSYGYLGKEMDDIFVDGHDSWNASVALNIPVFDGLLNRGLVAQTDAQIRRSETELQGSRRLVQVEVLEIIANLRMARGVLDAVILNLDRSQEVLEESLLMLEMGKTNYLDVLVAESNRAEARSNVIDARHEVLVLTATLKRAVGYSPLVALQEIPGLVVEVSE